MAESYLRANGHSFFGSTVTMGLYSKCYSYIRIKKEQVAFANIAIEKIVSVVGPSFVAIEEKVVKEEITTGTAKKVFSNWCLSYNKMVGLTSLKWKRDSSFCGMHRYPEKRNCNFDFKLQGNEAMVKADKIQRF